MLLVGFWHGLLQLTAPLVLVRIGDWRAIIIALAVVVIVSGWRVPGLGTTIGVGPWVMKSLSRAAQVWLTILWFLYGAALLLIPCYFHDQRGTFTVQGVPAPSGKLPSYSSFLPQAAVDSVANTFNFSPYASAWALLLISMLAVVVLGLILSMSFLSWYFAVSLAFQGHNNEVGGAARIEKFKHIVRIRIRRDDLTAFVIAIDNPSVNAYESHPKLIDVFTLRVT
jgi:hypothetical protein